MLIFLFILSVSDPLFLDVMYIGRLVYVGLIYFL